ncbi:hypothetical protein [Pseudoalteromonas sp. 1181_04]|uniref:hypothetical protein n=1 Tax=Pseudoalteromonas sp. 1181_04 TaxID=2604450 RepID=UPI00406353CD
MIKLPTASGGFLLDLVGEEAVKVQYGIVKRTGKSIAMGAEREAIVKARVGQANLEKRY